jgi:uncharacterized protein YbjT (DUF2867 family)
VDAAIPVLADRSHAGRKYELTGPASISVHEVADALTRALGRQVRYVVVPPDAVKESMLGMGSPGWLADLMREYAIAYASGWGDFTTEEVRRLTGHEARSIEQFAREVFVPTLASRRREAAD